MRGRQRSASYDELLQLGIKWVCRKCVKEGCYCAVRKCAVDPLPPCPENDAVGSTCSLPVKTCTFLLPPPLCSTQFRFVDHGGEGGGWDGG
jgi:hypothetical protein